MVFRTLLRIHLARIIPFIYSSPVLKRRSFNQIFLRNQRSISRNQLSTLKIRMMKKNIFRKTQLFWFSLAIFGGYYLLNNQKISCQKIFQRNIVQNRVSFIDFLPETACYDPQVIVQLDTINGFAVTLIEGHNSEAAPLYLNYAFGDKIKDSFKQISNSNSLDEQIEKTLREHFQKIDSTLQKMFYLAYILGQPSLGESAASALNIIVSDDKLYITNIGSCQGVLCNEENDSLGRKINRRHLINHKKEQEILKNKFPDEKDIFVCKQPKDCLVKNRSRLTRCIGQFSLKLDSFNNPDNEQGNGFYPRIENFKGMYVDNKPDFKIEKLQKGDRFLVLGSGQLWQTMKKSEIYSVNNNKIRKLNNQIASKFDSASSVAEHIQQNALLKIAKQNNMSVEQLKNLSVENRKKTIGSLSLIVIDLKNQIK